MDKIVKKRKIDELGRIVLPIEMREQLGIKENNSLCMTLDSNRIILEKGREVDGLGRIVIPYELRQMLGIKEKEELEIQAEDGKIILSKV